MLQSSSIKRLMETPAEQYFGVMPDGKRISSYTITNGNGMQLRVIEYGAAITSLKVPLANGNVEDVVLGFDTIEAYLESINLKAPPHFGAAIGRWSGRISKGQFALNQNNYQLGLNNGGHSLHGGRYGFSQTVWKMERISTKNNPSITFSYLSPDGDEHFPGKLQVEVTYTISEENELIVDFWAAAEEDTIVNLTQHSYFNLNGHRSHIADQQLSVNAEKILETIDMIPTGLALDVDGTLFDFRSPQNCPHTIDATFVLDKKTPLAATLFNPRNKLKMAVYTTQPAVHIYVGGDCFNILKGKEDAGYHSLSGICFETQNFPDAPNHANFPDPILRKGQNYKQSTTYKFTAND